MISSVNDAPTTLDRLIGFGRYLRNVGLPVTTDRSITFCRAACALDPLDLGSLYWSGRTTLISSVDEIAAYDAAFRSYFMGAVDPPSEGPEDAVDSDTSGAELGHGLNRKEIAMRATRLKPVDDALGAAASDIHVLKAKTFEALTDEERDFVERSIRQMKIHRPLRRARRLKTARTGRRVDMRGTLRLALRTWGEPVDRRWRRPRTRRRPLVMVLDVSGSMAAYSRALAQFGYAAILAGGRTEVFSFGTELTRITHLLHHRDVDIALRRLSADVRDWDGGTKIGVSLGQLVSRFSQSATLRGSVVIICSDGLDRGNPELLEREMARLRRLAHRIIWVNPLKGDPRYAPLARGMTAALPYVDDFVPGHNATSLFELAAVLERPAGRRVQRT